MTIEAMKQALEALENALSDDKPYIRKSEAAITDLRTAIKQAEKVEPVAWATMLGSYSHVSWGKDRPDYPIRYEVPLYTTPPAAPVKDEHQAFIDALPKDGEDKMFMQISHWARESYKRYQSSVRGQMITAADAYESHVIWATLRWAKENTPPAAPVQEPYGYVSTHTSGLMHFNKTFHGVYTDTATEIVAVYTHPSPAAQRQWVGLTDEARAVIDAARAAMDESTEANDGEGSIKISSHLAASMSLCLDEYDRAIEAKLREKNGGQA